MSFIDDVIANRLKKLRGDIETGSSPRSVFSSEKKSNVEQVDDLLRQISEETRLDAECQRDIDNEIRLRLDRLKEATTKLGKDWGTSEARTVPNLVEDVVSKFRDLAALEEKLTSPPETPEECNDELPWCDICNEDAEIRCAGCDNDLYCFRCFNSFHEDKELREHQRSPYKPPK